LTDSLTHSSTSSLAKHFSIDIVRALSEEGPPTTLHGYLVCGTQYT